MYKRVFTLQDQTAFAELSGDNNPLHLDEVEARRSMFGGTVVHGVHLVLWALDTWLRKQKGPVRLKTLKASFASPVRVGEEAGFVLVSDKNGEAQIEIWCGGAPAAFLDFSCEAAAPEDAGGVHDGFPAQHDQRVLSEEEIKYVKGGLELYSSKAAATALFPDLARLFSRTQLAFLLATTRLVGVECPGLHSLYSELELTRTGAPGGKTLDYEVENFDKRFALALIKVQGASFSGAIKAFLRPKQRNQARYADLLKQVHRAEFAHQRALIIGGSRGLGEVAAKLLSAGGAQVWITYHQGRQEAGRLAEEIAKNKGAIECFPLDVLNPEQGLADISANGWAPTHLYYFATPFIFAGKKGVFSPELFGKFCAYYVTGFVKVAEHFGASGLKNIFYPSSSAIDELPPGMGEYAAAKAAGETTCGCLGKTHSDMVIHCPRLPRLATDQTASLSPVDNADPVPVLLKELRSIK